MKVEEIMQFMGTWVTYGPMSADKGKRIELARAKAEKFSWKLDEDIRCLICRP